MPDKELLKKYEEEICKECKATECQKNIIILSEKNESGKESKIVKCTDYFRNKEKRHKPIHNWQSW